MVGVSIGATRTNSYRETKRKQGKIKGEEGGDEESKKYSSFGRRGTGAESLELDKGRKKGNREKNIMIYRKAILQTAEKA